MTWIAFMRHLKILKTWSTGTGQERFICLSTLSLDVMKLGYWCTSVLDLCVCVTSVLDLWGSVCVLCYIGSSNICRQCFIGIDCRFLVRHGSRKVIPKKQSAMRLSESSLIFWLWEAGVLALFRGMLLVFVWRLKFPLPISLSITLQSIFTEYWICSLSWKGYCAIYWYIVGYFKK